MGDIDELNSAIGLLLTESLPDRVRERLTLIQHRLFDLGSELAIPGQTSLTEHHVTQPEQWLDEDNAALPAVKEFMLPSGCRAAAVCHLARTVCCRPERRLVALADVETASRPGRRYLNRLSDLLFVTGRVLNRHHGGEDVYWNKNTPTSNYP